MTKKLNNLGSRTNSQKSISGGVNIQLINQIYLDKIDFFRDFAESSNDEHINELYKYFKFNKEFNFTVNKNMEYFIIKNQKNIQKIIKYIIFRYKFYLAGNKKINLGYPPYLLIEPVSACNLRCPFCFQTDKSFTKKSLSWFAKAFEYEYLYHFRWLGLPIIQFPSDVLALQEII